MSDSTAGKYQAQIAAIQEKRANYFAKNKIICYEGLDKDDYLLDKDYLIIQNVIAASPIGKDVLFKRGEEYEIEDGPYCGGHLVYAKSDQCLFLFEPDEWTFDFRVEGDNAEWHALVKEILIALDDEGLSHGWDSMLFLDDECTEPLNS